MRLLVTCIIKLFVEITNRYQEDASSIQALQLSPQELQSSLSRLKTQESGHVDWDPSTAGSHFLAQQVAYFGIFDGCVIHSLTKSETAADRTIHI